LLKAAVVSCLQQKHRPLEIVIGDDSGDNRSADVLTSIVFPDGVRLRHKVHELPLRQGRNVNWLFANAAGARCCLLHDDDLLCDGGLDILIAAFTIYPNAVCVYGKQKLMSNDGFVLEVDTEEFNTRYGRTADKTGPQASPLSAGLTQQLPNNGYLVDSNLARRIGYSLEEEVGQGAVDLAFGIRLGSESAPNAFVYVDHFVSFYRLTAESILRSRHTNKGYHLIFQNVEALAVGAGDAPARDLCLRRLGAEAVLDAAIAGQRRLATRILLSRHYRLSFFDPRTLFRLIYLTFPKLGGWLNARITSRRS
jgi:glycosyltransferase involved in cell wall biosynthesis